MQFKINSFEGRVKVKYFCIIYLILKTTADVIERAYGNEVTFSWPGGYTIDTELN